MSYIGLCVTLSVLFSALYLCLPFFFLLFFFCSSSPPGEWDTFCEDFDDAFCGKPSQALYHVPSSWLKAPDDAAGDTAGDGAEDGPANRLVVFDEIGARRLDDDMRDALVVVRDLHSLP